MIAPTGSLEVHEEAWNAYPYCKVKLATVFSSSGWLNQDLILREMFKTLSFCRLLFRTLATWRTTSTSQLRLSILRTGVSRRTFMSWTRMPWKSDRWLFPIHVYYENMVFQNSTTHHASQMICHIIYVFLYSWQYFQVVPIDIANDAVTTADYKVHLQTNWGTKTNNLEFLGKKLIWNQTKD